MRDCFKSFRSFEVFRIIFSAFYFVSAYICDSSVFWRDIFFKFRVIFSILIVHETLLCEMAVLYSASGIFRVLFGREYWEFLDVAESLFFESGFNIWIWKYRFFCVLLF